jgi:hypothetical protein
MNLDDESLLSAFMDGQLDPDQHQAVEAAVLSNPQLSEQLRTLTVLRDLVGGLSRDVSVDVSTVVLERIRPGRRWWARLPATIPWPTGRGRVLQATGLLGIAASIIIVVTVALNIFPALRNHRSNPASNSASQITASNDHKRATNADPIPVPAAADSTNPSSSSSSSSESREPGTVKISDIPHPIANGEINDLAEHRELEHVRKMLDSPNRRRFFLVRGGRDGTARQQVASVASVVEQTTHFDFYKITISQGIVIDPQHPEEATVFALLVNPKELDNLRERLNAALPDSIEETKGDPQIVTQLADIGQVQAYVGTPIVTIPHDAVALRTKGAEGRDDLAAEIQATDKRPTAEQERSGPVPPDRIPKTDHALGSGSAIAKHATVPAPIPAHSPEKPEDMIVVLVWVTKSPSG